jgi:hypothetical protein
MNFDRRKNQGGRDEPAKIGVLSLIDHPMAPSPNFSMTR